jgi:hypothetical protein
MMDTTTDTILAHRQAVAAEIADNPMTMDANKLFLEQKRETTSCTTAKPTTSDRTKFSRTIKRATCPPEDP